MDQLHAYWRMEYIEAPKKDAVAVEDLFLTIPQTKDDASVYLLYRGKHCYIVLNRYPYNAGHLLVVPYKQVPTLEALNDEERLDLINTTIKAQSILKNALNAEGFNVGCNLGVASGAGIPNHLHCHVVPRWTGDTNFMPVIGGTKVLPQSLDAMYRRLLEFV